MKRCLEKDRELRWSHVGELALALAPFASPAHAAMAPRIAQRMHDEGPTLERPSQIPEAPPRPRKEDPATMSLSGPPPAAQSSRPSSPPISPVPVPVPVPVPDSRLLLRAHHGLGLPRRPPARHCPRSARASRSSSARSVSRRASASASSWCVAPRARDGRAARGRSCPRLVLATPRLRRPRQSPGPLDPGRDPDPDPDRDRVPDRDLERQDDAPAWHTDEEARQHDDHDRGDARSDAATPRAPAQPVSDGSVAARPLVRCRP